MRGPELRLISDARRRQRLLVGLALAVAIGVVVVVVIAAGSSSPGKGAGNSGAPPGAATVRRRSLVETDTESGTLSYADPQTVYNRLSGTITWLPNVGREIKPGAALYRVDGEPVILMDGATPAYRTLSAADGDGPDITQLNRNLVRLGFNADAIVADDIWQPATTLGVALLQQALGEAPTGSLSLGQVVFLRGPQLVSAVDAALGGTGGGGSGGGSSADSAAFPAGPPAPEFVDRKRSALPPPGASLSTSTPGAAPAASATTTTVTAPAAPAPRPGRSHRSRPVTNFDGESISRTLRALTATLKAEAAELRAETAALKAKRRTSGTGTTASGSPGRSSGRGDGAGSGSSGANGSGGSGGSGGSAGGANPTAILQTTSTHLVVTVDLAATSQREATVGEPVTVELPSGDTVPATVTAVSPVAQSSSSSDSSGGSGAGAGGSSGGGGGTGSSSGSSSTVPVTVTLRGHRRGAGLDQAAVSVNFVEQRARHVLSVPVTALVAVTGGSYALQEADAPHTLIPVTTGLFAAGYVQVSGAGVYPGLRVTDSQG